jgi:hypothetical protein
MLVCEGGDRSRCCEFLGKGGCRPVEHIDCVRLGEESVSLADDAVRIVNDLVYPTEDSAELHTGIKSLSLEESPSLEAHMLPANDIPI